MRSISNKIAALVCCLLVSGVGTTFADDGGANGGVISSMQDQIRQLNKQISMLESKMVNMAAQPVASAPVYSNNQGAYLQPVGEGDVGTMGHLLSAEDIYVGGHVDVQYNQNLTRGGNSIAGGNQGRILDTDRESFTVNAVELQFIREANADGGAGFRADVLMGEDAQVINGDGTNTDKFDLQQAYIEYVQPLSFFEDSDILPGSINIKAGRMETLAGFEVISGPDNWNISRSFAFGLTVPFNHTGVRTNFGLFDDFFDVYLGVNNGWDNAVDNNEGKTLETGIGWSPIESLEVFHALYWGNENTSATDGSVAGGNRVLLTNTAKIQATDALTLAGELNMGNEASATGGTAVAQDVEWYSYAGYARLAVTERDAFTYRAELMKDEEGFRSAAFANATAGTTSVGARTLWSHTLTYEREVMDNLLARAEYRLDHCKSNNAASGASCFGDDNGQQTIGAQLIYLIG